MEFRIAKKPDENIYRYPTADIALASQFMQELKKELGEFLLGVVVFGSSARRESGEQSDIDVLMVGDDASYHITQPFL